LHGCAKSAHRGSGTAIIGEREGEGVLAGKAVAFNSHEAGWWNAIKGEKARFVAKRKGIDGGEVKPVFQCALIAA
jgi:hypothetical protein